MNTPTDNQTTSESPSCGAACSAVLSALENEIEFANSTAHHCGLENLDMLFQYWHGMGHGLTRAMNIIKQNAKDHESPEHGGDSK